MTGAFRGHNECGREMFLPRVLTRYRNSQSFFFLVLLLTRAFVVSQIGDLQPLHAAYHIGGSACLNRIVASNDAGVKGRFARSEDAFRRK